MYCTYKITTSQPYQVTSGVPIPESTAPQFPIQALIERSYGDVDEGSNERVGWV